MFFACCVSVGQGQDRNWDLLNYHLYNAFSFLTGRLDSDLYPIGVQGYFNPLIDVPYYLLSVELIPGFPRGVAFLAGIPFGLMIVVVLRLARTILPPAAQGEAWLAPVATAIGVSGGMVWSEIGTTFGDIPVAVLSLAGLVRPLAILADRETIGSSGSWNRAILVAGLLMGCAAGLKPTASIYAPGALLGVTLLAGSLRVTVPAAIMFCAGWLVGFLLLYGWWGLALYRSFGNPFFPMFNTVFASPWVPRAMYGGDDRFFPRDAWQTFFYPFFWLSGRSLVVAEGDVRDPRFALAYVSIVGLAAAALFRRLRGGRSVAEHILTPARSALCIFVVVSFAVWEAAFSILRYAVGLEAISGIVIMLGVRAAIMRRPGGRVSAFRVPLAGLILLLAVVAFSIRPGWGRLKTYGAHVYDISTSAPLDGATIILADRPTSFILPFLRGRGITFVGIVAVPAPGILAEEVQRRIRGAAPAVVLIKRPPGVYADLLRPFGLRIDEGSCRPVANPFTPGIALCGTQGLDRS